MPLSLSTRHKVEQDTSCKKERQEGNGVRVRVCVCVSVRQCIDSRMTSKMKADVRPTSVDQACAVLAVLCCAVVCACAYQ